MLSYAKETMLALPYTIFEKFNTISANWQEKKRLKADSPSPIAIVNKKNTGFTLT